jgi:glycosyltransferase involved in cell wall biosynthesis
MKKVSSSIYLSNPHQNIPGTPVSITNGMHILWEMSPDLQQRFDLSNKDSALDFCVFCYDQVRGEYPYFPVCETMEEKKFFFGYFELEEPYPITPYMRHLTHIREYLSQLDLTKARERLRLWKHTVTQENLLSEQACFRRLAQIKVPVDGKQNVRLPIAVYACVLPRKNVLALGKTEDDFLFWLDIVSKINSPELAKLQKFFSLTDAMKERLHSLSEDNNTYPLTNAMRMFPVIQEAFSGEDSASPEERLLMWQYAVQKKEWLSIPAFKKSARTKVPVIGKDHVLLPIGLYALFYSRKDVIDAFDDEKSFMNWIEKWGKQEIFSLGIVYDTLNNFDQPCQNQNRQTKFPKAEEQKQTVFCPGNKLRNGINVIGYGFGELGIGEDCRSAIENCQQSGIPTALYNIPLAITSRGENTTYKDYVDESLPYNVNLYCLPGPEIVRSFFSLSPDSRKDRFQIFATPWELPHFPKPLWPLLNSADELWAPSRYIQTALREATDVPVYHMPLSVKKPFQTSTKGRLDFNLPEEHYLFLFIFDWLSWPQRKNPQAVIDAFFRAFPKNQEVGLVIKTMNAERNIKKIHELLAKYGNDKRVTIINFVLSDHDLFALYRCTNAYVSLHRAEGFGRTIAEAMLAERPVIVTNFSGNTDFCTPETAFLVNGENIVLEPDDYLFSEGQFWCDPDVNEAAEQMKFCYNYPEVVTQKTQAAKILLQKNHSPASVGRMYLKRLQGLGVL